MQRELKELIYHAMNGETDPAALPAALSIPDEFAEGAECGRIYEEVYAAKLRLSDRLGVDEDKDVEEIIGGMNRIAKILAFKMYDYGAGERAGCGL